MYVCIDIHTQRDDISILDQIATGFGLAKFAVMPHWYSLDPPIWDTSLTTILQLSHLLVFLLF